MSNRTELTTEELLEKLKAYGKRSWDPLLWKYVFEDLPSQNPTLQLEDIRERIRVLQEDLFCFDRHWQELTIEKDDGGGVCPICAGPRYRETCPNKREQHED